MKTQIELARALTLTPQMEAMANAEGLPHEFIREKVALGEIVIANHLYHPQQKVVGIGSGLRTKIAAAIGTSSDICDLKAEIRKAGTPEADDTCTMCSDFCAMKKGMGAFRQDIGGDKASTAAPALYR